MGWDLFDFTPDNPYTFLILWPGSDFLGQSLAVTTGATSTYSQTLAVSTGGTCTYDQILANESHNPAIKSRQFMGWDLFTSDNPYTFLILWPGSDFLGQSLAVTTGATSTYSQTLAVSTDGTCTYGQILAEESHNPAIKSRQFMGWDLFDFTPDNPYTFLILWPGSDFLGQSLAVTTGATSTYSQTLAVSTGGTCTYDQILANESHNPAIKSRQFMGWDLFTSDNPYTFLILWPGSDFLGQSLAVTTGATSTYSQTLTVSTGGTCTYGQMLAEESHNPAIKSIKFVGWDLFTSDNPYTFLILWPGSDFLGQSLTVTTGATSTYSQTLAVSIGGTCTYDQTLAEESHNTAIKSRQFMGWDLHALSWFYDWVLTSSAKVWP